MAHQVLEEYNSLPTTQMTNRMPQNWWLENGENYSIRNFELLSSIWL